MAAAPNEYDITTFINFKNKIITNSTKTKLEKIVDLEKIKNKLVNNEVKVRGNNKKHPTLKHKPKF